MIVRTSKLSDGEVLALVAELFSIHAEGTVSIGLIEGLTRTYSTADELRSYEYGLGDRNIQSFIFRFQEVESDIVQFARGVSDESSVRQNGAQAAFGQRSPSAYYDELAFFTYRHRSGNYRPLDEATLIAISETLNSKAAPSEASSDDEARRLSRVVSKQIDDLRKVNLLLATSLADARLKDEEVFRKRQEELDTSFNERLQELSNREIELERRRSELNDREPQHERRRLREHLTAQLQKSIAEPTTTAASREWWASIMYLLVASILIAISLALSINWSSAPPSTAVDSAAFWVRSAKSLFAGLAGGAFAWAGLAGLKGSARAFREYEQQIRRYAFDMDRASWTVETLLQMNSIESAQVPDQWLEAVCRDMFVLSPQQGEETRSLDALAALLDATARAKIGTNGFEFELDRKQAREVARQAD